MVVELRMQYCDEIIKDSFETYKTLEWCIITEFERQVDFQNHPIVWLRLLLNNDGSNSVIIHH